MVKAFNRCDPGKSEVRTLARLLGAQLEATARPILLRVPYGGPVTASAVIARSRRTNFLTLVLPMYGGIMVPGRDQIRPAEMQGS